MVYTLGNQHSLFLAGQTMALDAATTNNPTIGWPGDAGNTTVQAWVSNLVPTYLTADIVLQDFEAPGVPPIAGISAITGSNIPFLVYRVRSADPGNTIFLVTRNWGGFGSPLLNTNPYGSKGIVVFHKGGDGEILFSNQATGDAATNGGLPGETNGSAPLR